MEAAVHMHVRPKDDRDDDDDEDIDAIVEECKRRMSKKKFQTRWLMSSQLKCHKSGFLDQ